jgi:hypothetical protein
MLIHTLKSAWTILRDKIASADWPTTAHSYNPAGTVTHRLVSRLVDILEAEIVPLRLQDIMGFNGVVLRATFNDNGGTATAQLFGACCGELNVKYLGSIALVAGTQTNSDGRYFAKTAVLTSYGRLNAVSSPDETGTGISELEIATSIYDRIWVGFTAVSAGDNVSIEANGF